MITPQHQKERLCLAHIGAIAGMAGVIAEPADLDYGMDGTLKEARSVRQNGKVEYSVAGFLLEFQAKASTRWRESDGHIVYPLDARAHRNLASRAGASEHATRGVVQGSG